MEGEVWVKPQDHHSQSVSKQAKETTKAKTENNKHKLWQEKQRNKKSKTETMLGIEESCQGKNAGARGIR